jgi:hypothetical protein
MLTHSQPFCANSSVHSCLTLFLFRILSCAHSSTTRQFSLWASVSSTPFSFFFTRRKGQSLLCFCYYTKDFTATVSIPCP